MFSTSADIIRSNFLLLLLLVLMGVGTDIAAAYSPAAMWVMTGVNFVGVSFWQVKVVQAVLSETRGARWQVRATIIVVLKGIAVFLFSLLCATVFLVAIRMAHIVDYLTALRIAALFFTAVYFLLLVVSRTWVPAGVHGQHGTLKRAIRTGLKRFVPCLLFLGFMGLVFLALIFLAIFAAAGFSFEVLGREKLDAAEVAASVFRNLVSYGFITLWMVVSTRDYVALEEVDMGEKLLAVF
ncbi:hypothetical protein [Oryzifoliimicrobium ureilyticus]|uniref:hypothetical protein n=1 Tax=Oryzifoliimicrobium ureilyticus TaxID=3113724 RepID=UPI0030767BAB